MALTVLQSLSQPYRAVISTSASAMSTPKRSIDQGVITAEINLTLLTDQTGAPIGTATNPIIVTSTAAAGGTPLGYQQITNLTASTALTVPGGATRAVIQSETANVRWRDDGTAPTASVGMLMYFGQNPQTFSGDLAQLRFIQTAANAVLDVSYYSS